jgi:hypothetical protein
MTSNRGIADALDDTAFRNCDPPETTGTWKQSCAVLNSVLWFANSGGGGFNSHGNLIDWDGRSNKVLLQTP